MVPMGQYTHQDRGRNSTMVNSPRIVEVSITPKKPKAYWATQGATPSTWGYCQGSLKAQSRVTVLLRGAPVNTFQVP